MEKRSKLDEDLFWRLFTIIQRSARVCPYGSIDAVVGHSGHSVRMFKSVNSNALLLTQKKHLGIKNKILSIYHTFQCIMFL